MIIGPPLPISPPTWDFTADKIAKTTSDALSSHEEALNKIAALTPEECNFETVLRTMANADLAIELALSQPQFMQYVSTDKAIRDASVETEKKTSEYSITASMRMDVFESLKHAEKNTDVSKLSAEEKRFLEKELVCRPSLLSTSGDSRFVARSQEIWSGST